MYICLVSVRDECGTMIGGRDGVLRYYTQSVCGMYVFLIEFAYLYRGMIST